MGGCGAWGARAVGQPVLQLRSPPHARLELLGQQLAPATVQQPVVHGDVGAGQRADPRNRTAPLLTMSPASFDAAMPNGHPGMWQI